MKRLTAKQMESTQGGSFLLLLAVTGAFLIGLAIGYFGTKEIIEAAE